MHGILALDQGSHASRAVVFDAAGRECASAKVAIATQRRAEIEVEHDARELLASVRAAAERALAAARQARGGLEIVAAGLATQRSTFVACDRTTLAPLAPAISWQDRRNAAWLECLRAHEPRVRALTGLPLSAHYGASKMRWCLDHLPAVTRAAARGELLLLPLAAWLVGHLTGRVVVDPALPPRTAVILLHEVPAKVLALPDAVSHEDFAGLWAARQAEDARLVAFTDSLSEERIRADFTYSPITNPSIVTHPLGPALAHVFNHQTHHRGQCHGMLTALGGPSITLDLIYFVRNEGVNFL